MEPMQKALVACRALALATALVAGTAAAFGGAVYLPVVDPVHPSGSTHLVQVWMTNTGGAQGTFSATVLDAESDGTQRPAQPPPAGTLAAGRTSVFGGVSAAGKVRLLEVSLSSGLSLEARLISTAPNGSTSSVSPVPLISSDNLLAAGKTAALLGLRRDGLRGDSTGLGIVNLAKQASQCTVQFFRADGSQIAATATLAFKPLSLRFFDDAFHLLGEPQAADARAQVSCDQPFYAFATLYTAASSQLQLVVPAPSGASTLTVPGDTTTTGGGDSGGGSTDGTPLFSAPGTFHTASPGHEKKTFNITLPHAVSLRRMVVEMDVIPGPWNTAKAPGNHAILWLYRGRFRGNTIANVNAFSPPKLSFKAAQNVDLPATYLTQAEGGLSWVQGTRYHLRYTYDAEHGTVTAALSSGGATLRTLTFPATAPHGTLDVPATGLTAEFGHYANQEGPEVASYGWSYADLRISGVPY
jgi:hypothetical protein